MAGYEQLAFYYDALTQNAAYETRCDRICSLLAAHGAGEGILLDLACGTGTLSLMLARRGWDVIGVDASEEMLSQAQEKKMNTGADVIFLCQRMEALDLFGTIDAAVCTLDSFNHLESDAAFREALRRVALFMNDGGVFIFDVNTPYKHAQVLGNNTFVYDTDEVFCVWQNAYSAKDCRVDITLDLFEPVDEEDGYVRSSEQFSERAWPPDTIKTWLEAVRFEVVALLDEDGGPLREGSERAVFVCKKHGTQFQN